MSKRSRKKSSLKRLIHDTWQGPFPDEQTMQCWLATHLDWESIDSDGPSFHLSSGMCGEPLYVVCNPTGEPANCVAVSEPEDLASELERFTQLSHEQIKDLSNDAFKAKRDMELIAECVWKAHKDCLH